MSIADIARQTMEAAVRGDAATARKNLTDDFVLVGAAPEPLGADQWLGLHQMLHAAMPDISFNISDTKTQGDTVTVTIQLSGTHKNTLDLSPMGLPVVPATGIRFQLPVEQPQVKFKGDKASAVHLVTVPGGGVLGILAQLGVKLPAH